MQNQVIQSLKPFPFIYTLFPKCQRSQYIMHDELDLSLLHWFGASHLVCWQGKNITNYRWAWPLGIASTPYFCIQLFIPKWSCRHGALKFASLIDENKDVIEKIGLLELEESGIGLQVFFLMFDLSPWKNGTTYGTKVLP
jgi:hypothetical protein